jgi:hypothetical protein
MSLVVARQIGQEIRIISDTKMMGHHDLRQTPFDGGLKCIVLSPTCCVSFVGNARSAEIAMAPIIGGSISTRDAIDSHLLKHHCNSRDAVDFLVGTSGEGVHIDRIAGGAVEKDLPATWIGDHAAFAAYQAAYHVDAGSQPSNDFLEERFQIANRMGDAFGAVIADPTIVSVEDFTISVTSSPAEEDGFRYLARAGGYGFKTVSLSAAATSLLQTVGAEGGSYNYSVLVPTSAGVGAVAVYIREAGLGALFFPAKSWRAILSRESSIEVFIGVIREQYGVSVDGVRI